MALPPKEMGATVVRHRSVTVDRFTGTTDHGAWTGRVKKKELFTCALFASYTAFKPDLTDSPPMGNGDCPVGVRRRRW